uniref:TIR domain-containing adapter molecule 1 isoform X2 n=1 Tax=Jaculus jaculus TaxID=51337 RepID=UPI001E1B273E|nr:TIR domain-containing adapter molecule 1 isoform X2 [Jaculus jaculus]
MASPGPSLPGVFHVLEAAGKDKLVHFKHKLRTLHTGSQGARLLHAMVLLTLGQDTEARISLEAMKGDAVAQLVACQWAGVNGSEPPVVPQDVSWTVARLFHLLAKENLCPASMRDMAYEVALHELNSQDDQRLSQLQDEARDRCGWDIRKDPSGFQELGSNLGCLPPPSTLLLGTQSQAYPINVTNWSWGHSLRSTVSPTSLASKLEISQSPTLPFLSLHCVTHGPSKLCETPPQVGLEPNPIPVDCQEPEEVSWPPSVETVTPLEILDNPGVPEVAPDLTSATLPNSLPAPEATSHNSGESVQTEADPESPSLSTLECTEKTSDASKQTPLQDSIREDTLQNSTLGAPAPAPPPQNFSSAPPSSFSSSCPVPPASSSHCPSPCHPDTSSEQKFYNFVILHARADEHVALRVRDKLEALGVPDGATFCEDFQLPGRGELRCLQDAIDHSGFTILLLTANYDCRLSLHQVNQALMNSFTQSGRQDCAIPFLPLECSRAQLSRDTSGLLESLVWLDEHSPIFERKVANTFKLQKLRIYRERWKKEQDARVLREHSQRLDAERRQVAAMHAAHSAYAHSYVALQEQVQKLSAAFGDHLSLGTRMSYSGSQVPMGVPPPFPTWPGGPHPPPVHSWQGGTLGPTFPQHPNFLQPPTSLQPPAASPQTSSFQQAPSFPQTPSFQHTPSFSQTPSFQQVPSFPQSPAFPRTPSCPQTPPFPPASSTHPQTPGPQPLIIHHAQMVQLGLTNHMWTQREAQAPDDKTK